MDRYHFSKKWFYLYGEWWLGGHFATGCCQQQTALHALAFCNCACCSTTAPVIRPKGRRPLLAGEYDDIAPSQVLTAMTATFPLLHCVLGCSCIGCRCAGRVCLPVHAPLCAARPGVSTQVQRGSNKSIGSSSSSRSNSGGSRIINAVGIGNSSGTGGVTASSAVQAATPKSLCLSAYALTHCSVL